MIEAVNADALGAAGSASGIEHNDNNLNPNAEARFLEALESPEADYQGSMEQLNSTSRCQPGSSGQCMGDKLLDNLQKIKSEYDDAVNAINDSVSSVEITPQGLLKLQMEIAKLQMQEELMAKTASKSTQNIDTLLKSQ